MFYFILFYFILFYLFILFCMIVIMFILFFDMIPWPTSLAFHSILFWFVFFCVILRYFILFFISFFVIFFNGYFQHNILETYTQFAYLLIYFYLQLLLIWSDFILFVQLYVENSIARSIILRPLLQEINTVQRKMVNKISLFLL